MGDINWEIIKKNALTAIKEDVTFYSFRRNRIYKILSVQDKIIIINRVSGGKPAGLTMGKICKSIEILKENNSSKNIELTHNIVLETILVHLHPNIKWDSKNSEVYWSEINPEMTMESAESFIRQASDDELEKILVQINNRKNQNKFRKALLKLYDNRCAISSVSTDVVLEAAHILPHSITGINSSENGILLRSDLHGLFDNDLLLIHPIKLSIHIHPSLKHSYYSIYEGKELAKRIDNSKPSSQYLQEKWKKSTWSKSIK